MKVARVGEDEEADMIESLCELLLSLRGTWTPEQDLLLVFEAFVFLEYDATRQVFCPVDIRWKPDCHQFFSVFFFDIVEVSLVLSHLVRMERRFVAHRRHREEVALPELEGEWDGEVERAIPQVVVVVFVLVHCLHEGDWVTYASSHLVKHEARALVHNEHCLAIFGAETRNLAPDDQHSVYRDVLLVEVEFRDDFTVDHSFRGPYPV